MLLLWCTLLVYALHLRLPLIIPCLSTSPLRHVSQVDIVVQRKFMGNTVWKKSTSRSWVDPREDEETDQWDHSAVRGCGVMYAWMDGLAFLGPSLVPCAYVHFDVCGYRVTLWPDLRAQCGERGRRVHLIHVHRGHPFSNSHQPIGGEPVGHTQCHAGDG